jgi:hypothetical protein
MPSRFECRYCGSAYDVADAMAGKTILCRACEQRSQVPAAAAATTPPVRGRPPGVSATPSPTRRRALLAVAGLLPLGLLGGGAYVWLHQTAGPEGGSPGRGGAGDGDPGAADPAGGGNAAGGRRGRGGRGGWGRGGGGFGRGGGRRGSGGGQGPT